MAPNTIEPLQGALVGPGSEVCAQRGYEGIESGNRAIEGSFISGVKGGVEVVLDRLHAGVNGGGVVRMAKVGVSQHLHAVHSMT
ncbi:hypothetical protein ACA910_005904 [Epithemia clementina (nom. ined.)]